MIGSRILPPYGDPSNVCNERSRPTRRGRYNRTLLPQRTDGRNFHQLSPRGRGGLRRPAARVARAAARRVTGVPRRRYAAARTGLRAGDRVPPHRLPRDAGRHRARVGRRPRHDRQPPARRTVRLRAPRDRRGADAPERAGGAGAGRRRVDAGRERAAREHPSAGPPARGVRARRDLGRRRRSAGRRDRVGDRRGGPVARRRADLRRRGCGWRRRWPW